MQNSYKLARTRRHVVGMLFGPCTHIEEFVQVSYKLVQDRNFRVYLFFVINIVDMSYGTRRIVLTKTLVTQLVDSSGDMWRIITRANSSRIGANS